MNDLERMREFYVTSFGGRSGAQYHNPRTGLRSYFIAFGEGCRIELMEGPGVAFRPEGSITGYAHLALSLGSREAVDEAVLALGKRGVRITSGPRTTGDGYYEAVILDPEGNPIELVA
jgi:lactoylglutathione lyase